MLLLPFCDPFCCLLSDQMSFNVLFFSQYSCQITLYVIPERQLIAQISAATSNPPWVYRYNSFIKKFELCRCPTFSYVNFITCPQESDCFQTICLCIFQLFSYALLYVSFYYIYLLAQYTNLLDDLLFENNELSTLCTINQVLKFSVLISIRFGVPGFPVCKVYFSRCPRDSILQPIKCTICWILIMLINIQ